MTLAELHRQHYGRILASLVRVVRDLALAEDALQEAFAAALVQWPRTGEPANPIAWLTTTARHKAIDHIRRRTLAGSREQDMVALSTPETSAPADTLRLIFTCCHPALAPEAQVALTLHTLGGLTTEEIARAFVVPVPTLAQRLVRAKTKIKLARIPYEIPEDGELPERIESVLAVIYLIFNEGYAASAGADLVRADLCAEAIRLAMRLVELLPGEREAQALLALMLLNDARRLTRTDAAGDLVLLEDQDRARWDHAQIARGAALVEAVLRAGPPGRFALEAAIAALHAQACTAAETDWPQIAALYAMLARVQPSPVVELNRAVAIALAGHLEAGLVRLERLELPGYYLLPAARADLLRRLGRAREAAAAYRQALDLVQTAPERRFLERRLAQLGVT